MNIKKLEQLQVRLTMEVIGIKDKNTRDIIWELIEELIKIDIKLETPLKSKIENLIWILPRPRRKDKYKGRFPMHFEKKLFELYNWPTKILQPFGGMAEYGERVDIKPEVKPDYIGDAHNLNFIKDNTYDFILLDPPYSCDLSGKLYNTGKLKYYTYMAEAVRVCKPSGFIAMYHWFITPRPKGASYHRRIFIGTRIWHHPRVCTIFRKD